MNIAVIGYGRMGREIEQLARQNKHNVCYTVDPLAPDASCRLLQELSPQERGIDVAIEFSVPTSVLSNAQTYAELGIPVVVGTTGWQQDRAAVQSLVENSGIAYLFGSNFSIGAHVFMKTAEFFAELIDKAAEYDIALNEIHHTKKIDRPSGTALSTAKKMLTRLSRKKDIATDLPKDSPIDSDSLAVLSQRVGQEPGFHEVIADSSFDSIHLSHRARSRAGFALGAVRAAEWLYKTGRKGFITVENFIDEYFSS